MEQLLDIKYLIAWVMEHVPIFIGGIITLIIGLWLAKKIDAFIIGILKTRGVDETILPFLDSMIGILLKVMVLITVAGMFGIETASFIAVLGALTFAVGMALQGSLAHFASGVLLILFKPYKVGDLVEIGGSQKGTVEGIHVFNTILCTLDNKRIVIPNSLVTSNIITNITGQGIVGVELTFGISYNDDIDKARSVILEVGKSCKYILDEPAQAVVVDELGDSSVNLATRPFVKSEHYWDTYFYMKEHVKKAFDQEGVGIPFPTMDINVFKN